MASVTCDYGAAEAETTTFTYDNSGHLTSLDYSSGTPDVALQYDALNRVIQMTDGLTAGDGPGANDTLSYTWDATVPDFLTSLNLQQPAGSWAPTPTATAAPSSSKNCSGRCSANCRTPIPLSPPAGEAGDCCPASGAPPRRGLLGAQAGGPLHGLGQAPPPPGGGQAASDKVPG